MAETLGKSLHPQTTFKPKKNYAHQEPLLSATIYYKGIFYKNTLLSAKPSI